MAVSARDVQAIEAAKLYYVDEMSQARIAELLEVSRPTVSKLIQHARDAGFVTINITDPREAEGELVAALRDRYSLDEVVIAATPVDDDHGVLSYLGHRGAEVVASLVADGDLVGVGWGNTIHELSRHLPSRQLRGVEVIQLKGGLTYSGKDTKDVEIIENFCRAFGAYGRYLPLPVIFDSVDVKTIVENERHIRQSLQLGATSRIAVFTIGGVDSSSTLFNLGYLTEAERQRLQANAVGDILSRYFDSEGRVADEELDARTLAIPLEDLKRIDHRVLVAGGPAKTEAIRTALTVGYANHLVTDHHTARRLVD
ncbi:sugar-binding transcriptional regulator [Enemella sp. A6]|uniref:sugar-binding transcriptional regulator n=1 Tax=Enemella sp. A6 TaxID=3440152 RepID=UPI003EBDB795